MQEKLLKWQNAKLRNQFIFTLPATKPVCGRVCPGCYAIKPQVRFPKVLAYRERMLGYSKEDSFVDNIVAEITTSKRTIEAVRLHESGEFYSQEYVDKWTEIASRLPKLKFYTFTKRMKDFDFTALMALPNFVLIDSLMFGGLNYDKLEKLDQSRTICPATTSAKAECGVDCGYCWTKEAQANGVQFIKH